jgi:phosphatidylglycerol:prolipoprotein diacylglycerol transferase
MNPALFHPVFEAFGAETRHAYFVFQWLALFSSAIVVLLVAWRVGLSVRRLLVVTLASFVVGGLTSRIAWFLTVAKVRDLESATGGRPWWEFVQADVLSVWRGGHVYYGGVLGAVATAVLLGRWWWRDDWRAVLPRVVDLTAFSAITITAIGRIGCYFVGCCYGVIDHVHGHVFPGGSAAALELEAQGLVRDSLAPTPPLLPTQLIEAAGAGLLLVGLLIALVTVRPRPGVLAQVGFGLAAVLRFGVEFFRFDLRGGAGPFSTSQWIALVVLALVSGWAVWARVPEPASSAASPAGAIS